MKKQNNRDDFSQKTKNSLQRRAGNRCSNPECRVPTDAPSEEGPDKVNSIGEAAHITAAAPGIGARRYNPALKPEERRSIHNGIWLCANCADKIDKDDETYTVALLHEWKKKAEESATREQGKKLPDEMDAVNMLVAAATGQASVFLPNLMANASKAASCYLEKLDSRFAVETNFHNGRIHYAVYPKELVNFKIIADYIYGKELREKINESVKNGSDFVIDGNYVKFEGLPIIKEFEKRYLINSYKFEHLSRKNITIRLKTISPNSKTESFFYDLHGYAVLGTESIRIEAGGLNGLFLTKIKILIEENAAEVIFTVNFKLWDGLQLNSIQYFDKIYQLYYEMRNNWKLNISADSEGVYLFSSYCDDCLDFFNAFRYINFIKMAREVSRILKYSLVYNSSFEATEDDCSKLVLFYETLTSGSYKFPFKEIIHTHVKSNNFGVEILTPLDRETNFFSIKGIQEEHENITLFGQKLTLPKLSFTITIVEPKIVNKKHENINVDDWVEIELIPADNCECILEKISDARSD